MTRHQAMSTNYYATITRPPTEAQAERFKQACSAVVSGHATDADYAVLRGEADTVERLHIGKESAGWCFALHVWTHDADPGYPRNLTDWMRLLLCNVSIITDDQGERMTFQAMMEIIVCRRGRGGFVSTSVPGPHGLSRAEIGGQCIGHGDGTWDLFIGDFN